MRCLSGGGGDDNNSGGDSSGGGGGGEEERPPPPAAGRVGKGKGVGGWNGSLMNHIIIISLDKPLTSFQVHLNSKDAYFRSDDGSRCVFHFNMDVSPPPNVNILVSVVSFSCPMSYYVVNATNNKLHYTVSNGATQTYTI